MKYQQHLEAKATLAKIEKESSKYFIIHYACESFYETPMAKTPRITAIAVRSFESGQTYSFSMHQTAEVLGIAANAITSHYDDIEFAMLQDFAEFLRTHRDANWIHWNMRDGNYGFQAINHRYRILRNKLAPNNSNIPDMIEINDNSKVDLSLLLIRKYGARYIGNPRIQKLMEANKMSPKDFMTGAEEATAFANGNFHKLLLSTLSKVVLFSQFLQRAIDNDLKHYGKAKDVCDNWKTRITNFLTGNFYGLILGMLLSQLLERLFSKIVEWLGW